MKRNRHSSKSEADMNPLPSDATPPGYLPRSESKFSGLWSGDLAQAAAPPSWLWQGYVAAGMVTLLTSLWKSGKTTLMTHLLARMEKGGQLAGLPVMPGKVAYVSEENAMMWKYRRQRIPFGNNLYLLCRPFPGLPSHAEWQALLDHLLDVRDRQGLDLVVVDSLATFLSGHENLAASMLQALTPLQRLTAAGLGCVLVHHPRKGDPLIGQAARGTGALAGFVDIVMEMKWYRHTDPADRRRRLYGLSRFEETPRYRALELNPEGTDYLVLDDTDTAIDCSPWEPFVIAVLRQAGSPLTCLEITAQWPAAHPAPSAATLWRTLQQAIGRGTIVQQGKAHRHDPYRFQVASE
jgi:hypothetical protein